MWRGIKKRDTSGPRVITMSKMIAQKGTLGVMNASVPDGSEATSSVLLGLFFLAGWGSVDESRCSQGFTFISASGYTASQGQSHGTHGRQPHI